MVPVVKLLGNDAVVEDRVAEAERRPCVPDHDSVQLPPDGTVSQAATFSNRAKDSDSVAPGLFSDQREPSP
jgi:hypothetical protein